MEKTTRREIITKTATAAAALALGSMAAPARHAWAAPRTPVKYNLKLRQDYIYDGMFDMLLSGFNAKSKRLKIKSSYIDGDRGWGYERDTALDTPFWYTEGEQCDFFMGRGPALAQLADDGLIIPLDDFLANSGKLDRDDFHHSRYGGVLDSATYKGSLWGIPLIGDTYALFHNTDLYSAAGVTEKPTTWDETIDTARRLTRDTDGDGAPDVFGYSQCSFQFPLQLLTAGLDLVDLKNKRVLYDTDAGVEALDVYRRCKEWSPPHVHFENGDMGMKISVVTNAHGKYRHLNYVTTRLPEGRRRANTYGDSDGVIAFSISSKISPDRQLAAWKAIEYMTSARMFFKMLDYNRMLPMRNSIRNSDRYSSYLKKYPRIKPFVEELEWAVPKPCVPEYRFLEVVMREILLPVQAENGMDLSMAQLREHMKQQTERANKVLAASTW